jgi:hypothetical protein
MQRDRQVEIADHPGRQAAYTCPTDARAVPGHARAVLRGCRAYVQPPPHSEVRRVSGMLPDVKLGVLVVQDIVPLSHPVNTTVMLPQVTSAIAAGLNSGGNFPPFTTNASAKLIALPLTVPSPQIHARLPLRSKVNQHIHALVALSSSSMIPCPDWLGLNQDADIDGPTANGVALGSELAGTQITPNLNVVLPVA